MTDARATNSHEPPWPAGADNNAKREGWRAYFAGKYRQNCPFPRDRDDLRRGFEEGWDAAVRWAIKPSAASSHQAAEPVKTGRNRCPHCQTTWPADQGRECPGCGIGLPSPAPDDGEAELVARIIYERAFRLLSGWVPWVERGNSARQDEARRIARAILSTIRTENGWSPDDGEGPVNFYERDFYPLSNFSSFSVMWELSPRQGLGRFDTSEALYHWLKFSGQARPALVPRSDQSAIAHEIRDAASAHEAFKIAERHKSLRRRDWDEIKVGVMKDILRAKVDQHEYVARKLLATGDRTLVEGSWRDDFWGAGPSGTGQNVLGKLWMEVRAELRSAEDPPR